MESKTKETVDLKSSYQTLPADVFNLILQNVPIRKIEESLQKNEIKLTNKQFLNLITRKETYRLVIQPGRLAQEPDPYDQNPQRAGYIIPFLIFKGESKNSLFKLNSAVFHYSERYNNFLFINNDFNHWNVLIKNLKENKNFKYKGYKWAAFNSEEYTTLISYFDGVFTIKEEGQLLHRNNSEINFQLNDESRKQFAQELEKMLTDFKEILSYDQRFERDIVLTKFPDKNWDFKLIEKEVNKVAYISEIIQINEDQTVLHFSSLYDAVLVKSSFFASELDVESIELK